MKVNINEWEFEPNRMVFIHENLSCKIIRRPQGHLTCYVSLPKNHILFGKHYDEIYFLLKDKGIMFDFELSWSEFEDSFWEVGFGYTSIRDYIPEIDGSDNQFPTWMREIEDYFKSVCPDFNIAKEYKNFDRAIHDVKILAEALNLFSIKN